MLEERPLHPGKLVEPIVFEPRHKIQLSQLTYKVNSYIDFGPYHESFKKFESYLERFLKDIKDPEHVGALADLTWDKTQGCSYMPGTKTYFGPGTCKGGSYSCRVQKQYL